MINTTPTESNLSGLNQKDFQKDINNKKTDLFILKNAQGMEVAVTNYGCAILSIMVPDKNGKYANVVLGHDSIEHVINSPEPFLNTTIGRYGNRIAKGKFTLYGEVAPIGNQQWSQLTAWWSDWFSYPCMGCCPARAINSHLQLHIRLTAKRASPEISK